MARDRVHVDEEARRVVCRPARGDLWLRGALFVLVGVGLPAVVVSGDTPSIVTIPVLLVTAAMAAWFVAALRRGWEIDDHGIETDVGRRRITRLAWGDVASVRVDDRTLAVVTRDGRRIAVGGGDPDRLTSAVGSAVELGLVPSHVTVEDPPDH